MEEFCIPDFRRIMRVSYQTIDTFSTWCEDIEVHISSKFTGFPSDKVNNIIKRLTEYKPNKAFPSINRLFYFLTKTMLEVVKHEEVSGRVNSSSLKEKIRRMTSKSSSIKPVPSFDEETAHQYENDIKMLKKLIKDHQQIYRDIQRQEERKLKERDTAIKQLKEMLDERVKQTAEALEKHNRLLDTENTTRSTIRKLEKKITEDLINDMTERLNSGLSALRHLLSTKSNKRTNKLLSQIKEVESDMSSLVASIVDKMTSKYRCCNPQVFYRQKGFKARLPDFSLIKFKERNHKSKTEQKKTDLKDDNNNSECNNLVSGNFQVQNYLQPDNLPEVNTNSECITKLSGGTIVEQKLATESSEVVFGWVKAKPWCQKKWGFFPGVSA